MPSAIQWRTTKLGFSPGYHRRYRTQADRARSVLQAIAPTDPVRDVVDVARLCALLAAERGSEARQAAYLVLSGIFLIQFLRQFPEFRP